MLQKGKWTKTEPEIASEIEDSAEGEVIKAKVQGEVIKAKVHLAENDLLNRCLVGFFAGKEDTPTRNEVRRWAQQTWKGAQGVSIYDMYGEIFLFEFHSRKEAEHIMMGSWKRQGCTLKLQWWNPTAGSFMNSIGVGFVCWGFLSTSGLVQ
ncbi:hypothetical protein FXO38_09156 [Capsicum annuum]|nr:hypothetical protein FXO37_15820 [Capsicum annuum]KAF3666224.1 hypothetical protein FXO38_09156 [Capsicum annuum]